MAHILVIDDEAPMREAVAEILHAVGHTVSQADDGLTGAQLYRANPADVVLCDIMMEHSGLTLIRILCDQYPGIRIIANSGADPRRLEYALESGAMHALRKPYTSGELIAAVAKVLALPAKPASREDAGQG